MYGTIAGDAEIMKKALLGDYITGYSVKNKKDEEIPVYSVTNDRGFCTEYFSKDVSGKDKSKYKIVPRGYFAYNPSRINVGSVDWQNCENRVIVSPLYVVFKTDERLNQEYLKYYLKSDIGKFYINENAVGAVRANLKFDILSKFRLPIPDIEEQKNIVSQLNLIDEMIKLKEKEITVLDTMIKARFVEMFGDPISNPMGWEVKKLEQLCKVSSSKRIYQNEQSRMGVPFLRISDLVNKIDNGIAECGLFIPQESFIELKKHGLVPVCGDILLTARGTLGKCYIISEDDEFYFQDGMITWLSNYDENITALYISYLFGMPGFRKQIDALQAGSTVAYLSIAMTKKLNVMLPPIELQNQFANFVQQVDKSKLEAENAIEKLKTLQKNSMQQYFH